MSSSYNDWLENQNIILSEALELIKSFKFNASIISPEGKKAFIRILLAGSKADFHIKSIKNKFIKFVWVCKEEDFDPKANYLVYLEEEKKFLVSTGHFVDEEGEYRESDYHKNKKYVVAPIDIFRNGKTFFKAMQNRYNSMLQKRMSEWT